ncbi:MAG: AfsR/SARP family transcriptional regulator [Pseudonocardiaceae bacterium]|nr:AfsR/SARP family transcriptional regulator [Pseudonocardiaceae bacterium]
MRFGVLGPLEVWAADCQPVRVPELKVRALLANLLVHEGQLVPADRLIDDLWGDKPPSNAMGALHAKVSQLRRALDAEPGGRELVVYRSAGYLLRLEADALDVHRFQDLTARARESDDPRTTAALLSDALALWRGQAFADFADERFAKAAITRLEEQWLAAVEDKFDALLELDGPGAVDMTAELGELVRRYPRRERLRAAQMRALYRAGRQAEALESYHELREHLRDELGLDPSPGLVTLQSAILAQDPALRAEPAVPRPRTNLPAPVTDLIGREGAVAKVRASLDDGRLVTLTGPGGVGKTRLAMRAAAEPRYPDGVWLVELAALNPPSGTADVAGAVAAVLDIRDDAVPGHGLPPGEPVDLTDRLVGALRNKRMLLVLDNCEPVIEPVAKLAERLLQGAPGLRILATSQEPFAIAGEVLYPVAPLGLPDPGAEPAAVQRAGAVRLFVTLAAAAAPGFALDASNADAVTTICRRLDGIPLALELAATRVRAMGVRELAARLDDRFRLLSTGRRDGPDRQRTLRAMIDWSWQLLTEPERLVLRRLAVHSGGCTLEAAEVVCSADDLPAGEVLDLLARLVDRSLITVVDDGDRARYRLLESVAAYCTERLHEAGEYQRVRRRHLQYYVEHAECAAVHLRGRTQREWLERMDAETANLREALDGAVRLAAADLALRLVNAVAWYWFLRGRLGEARRSLAVALAVDGDASPSATAKAVAWQAGMAALAGEGDLAQGGAAARTPYDRISAADGTQDLAGQAIAHWLLSFAQIGVGDPAAGEELADRALAAFRGLDDRWGMAAALGARAAHAMFRGDLAALERDAAESSALFSELGDRWGQLESSQILGMLAELTGDHEGASRLYRDGLRIAEEFGLWAEVSYRLSRLGRVAVSTGDYRRATQLHERARSLAAEQANTHAELYATFGLALGARKEGRLADAEAHLKGCLETCRQLNAAHGIAWSLTELGFVAELRDDATAAIDWHAEGFAAARATGDPRTVARAVEGLAGARALAGRPDRAVQLLGTAAAARESVGTPLPPAERDDVDRIARRVRAALGEAAFAAEFDRGRALRADAASDP